MGVKLDEDVQQARDEEWMRKALRLAEIAAQAGEVPIGAVLVADDSIVAEGWNQPIKSVDPTAHAEIVTLRNAARSLGNYRLPHTTLYVTLEPCPMCAGALIHARVRRVVFGAHDPLAGAAGTACNVFAIPTLNHRVSVTGGVLGTDCGDALKRFFQARR